MKNLKETGIGIVGGIGESYMAVDVFDP